MKSLHSIISPVGEALVSALGSNVYHYWRPRLIPPYCVWAEDGEDAFYSENKKTEQGITGYVDYYTLTEYDPAVDSIQQALNSIGGAFAWRLDSVQYEEDTNLIHHQWVWSAA